MVDQPSAASSGDADGQSPEVQVEIPTLEGEARQTAEQLFGERLGDAERFVEHLAGTGIEWGLLGPREVPRLWERHVLNCAVVQELIPSGALVADVGTGAGLPGLALALARPENHFILVEPLERRVAWLDQVIEDVGIANVDVVRARAEQVAETLDVDIVTARAVSALKNLLSLTVPLLHGSGELLAIKGRSAQTEIDAARKALKRHRASSAEAVTVGEDLLAEPTTVVRVRIDATA